MYKYRNIPHVSIEVQMGIFMGKTTKLLFLQGIGASVKDKGFPQKMF